MIDPWEALRSARVSLTLVREQARLDKERAAYWRRSALGTWTVNLALSAVIVWLVWR